MNNTKGLTISAQLKGIRSSVKFSRDHKECLIAYLFLMPWIIGLLVFTFWPFLHSFLLSFTRSDIFSTRFIGFGNFKEMFLEDDRFVKSMWVTLEFVIKSVPLKLAFALLVAIVLEKNIKGMNLFRTVYYIPSLIGSSVAVAVMWRKIFGYDGLLNSMLALFGIHGKEWIGHPDYALDIMTLLIVWQFGSSMVIFLAGLKNIPKSLYEAAMV